MDVRQKIIDAAADMIYAKENYPDKFKEIMYRTVVNTTLNIKYNRDPEVKGYAEEHEETVGTLADVIVKVMMENPEVIIEWYDKGLVDEEMLKGL